MTTVSPAASAICLASSDTIPTWSQSTFAPIVMACRAISGASWAGRNTSTVGSYRARADGIGADAVASVEEGDAAGQADEAMLGGGVPRATSAAAQTALGGSVVDDSAVASDHVGQHGAGKQERSGEVDRDGPV